MSNRHIRQYYMPVIRKYQDTYILSESVFDHLLTNQLLNPYQQVFLKARSFLTKLMCHVFLDITRWVNKEVISSWNLYWQLKSLDARANRVMVSEHTASLSMIEVVWSRTVFEAGVWYAICSKHATDWRVVTSYRVKHEIPCKSYLQQVVSGLFHVVIFIESLSKHITYSSRDALAHCWWLNGSFLDLSDIMYKLAEFVLAKYPFVGRVSAMVLRCHWYVNTVVVFDYIRVGPMYNSQSPLPHSLPPLPPSLPPSPPLPPLPSLPPSLPPLPSLPSLPPSLPSPSPSLPPSPHSPSLPPLPPSLPSPLPPSLHPSPSSDTTNSLSFPA